MTTAILKPTIVIVPGAWHPATLYSDLASQFQTAGYGTIVASHPSLDSKIPETATCQQDTESLRQLCTSLIQEENANILLVCHSYGGIPGGGAASGLSKADRLHEGKSGGIIGLVYLSACIVPKGIPLTEHMGGKLAPYVVFDSPSPGLTTTSSPIPTFFNDIAPSLASRLASSLAPHAASVFSSPAPRAGWAEAGYDGKRGYLRCLRDQALPVAFQDMFIERSGVGWEVRDIDAGHDAFVGRVEEVCEMVVGFAGAFGRC